jgi:hypothetical protein
MSDIYDDNPLQLELGTEIRVLELLSDRKDDPKGDYEIACRLHTISLGDKTPFVAISYVWGAATDTQDIILDGDVFSVRTNLYRLLQKMARKRFSTYFWVDAICVNQRNVRERNQQVALMEQIYPKAASVIVWLNPQSTAVDEALILLAGMYKKGIAPEDYEQVKEALQELCYLEYWSRAWIVQEYTLAEHIELWGTDCSISGDVLAYAAYDYIWWLKQFKENREPITEPTHRIQIPWSSPAGKVISCRKQWRFSRSERQRIPVQQRRFTRAEGLPFDYVFSLIGEHGRQLQCADVRDRVYAMLSLLREDDSLKRAIVPDYSRSVSQLFFDICTKVCKEAREVEKFRTLLELSPDRRVVRFVRTNWPLRFRRGTYGSDQLDMCVALLLPRNISFSIMPRMVSAPGVLIPRHMAARVDLYASVPLQRGNSDNIRLLRILPRDPRIDESHIKCSLRTVPFAGFAPYSALSYAWAGEAATKPIYVNGHRVYVRENLEAFLREARRSNSDTEIWIDAVCVNQEDLFEKTHHAKLMPQIYSRAFKVIAWLGMDESHTGRASLEVVIKAHEGIRDPNRSMFGRHNWPPTLNAPVQHSLHTAHTVLDSLQHVLSNHYWKQARIVHEYMLARKVELWIDDLSLESKALSILCEAATTWPRRLPSDITDAELEVSARSLKSKSRILRSCWAMNIIMQRDLRQGLQNTHGRWHLISKPEVDKWQSLPHLVRTLAGSDCVDPRDRVYTLLPLITPEEFQYFGIVPDYSTPGSRLFIDLACAFCVRYGLVEGWDSVQHLAEPLCSEGYVDPRSFYELLGGMLRTGYGGRWQYLASQVVYEMSGKQACFEPHVRDGG